MRWLLRATPLEGKILDPFAGSATTGVAAILEGRQYLGIERTAAYAEAARKRLAQARQEFGWALDLETSASNLKPDPAVGELW
jgi:site-specific DNA-methyltransferase (adenine-specific)